MVPSFTDYLFVVLLVAHSGPSVLADADTGWHLVAGYQWLRHGPHAFPDPLSWTCAGAIWWNPQWLGELAFAWFHRYAGFVGVVLLAATTFAASMAWLYRRLVRACDHPPAALGVALLASAAVWPHLLARPEIFSFLLFLVVHETLRFRRLRRWRFLLVGVTTALWANAHPSAILAPLLALMCWWMEPEDRGLGVAALISIAALGL